MHSNELTKTVNEGLWNKTISKEQSISNLLMLKISTEGDLALKILMSLKISTEKRCCFHGICKHFYIL